ncbi:MAG: hypothetical protein IJ088_14465, partial [Clostridia bacterium]|nr:hypothetical protein [Clostridia bacterium]
TGASLVAFCAYKSNEEKVDAFLRRHGIKVKTPGRSFETMSVEDLMRTKEDIEDLIAEKELQDQSVTVNAEPVSEPAPKAAPKSAAKPAPAV